MLALLATLLAMSSVQIRNPAECSTLPPNAQRICTQEIRAGRAYESQDFNGLQEPAPVQAVATSQPVSQPSASGPSLEERRVLAAERTASATETIATIQVIALCMSIVSTVILLVVLK